jgi:hypothetical protein
MQVALDAFADSQDWLVHVTTRRAVTPAEYRAFCHANPELRIERSVEGEMIVMAPALPSTVRPVLTCPTVPIDLPTLPGF